MNKRIIFVMICIFVGVILLVSAFSPDEYYVKKSGDEILVYQKVATYSTDDLSKEETKLLTDKDLLEDEYEKFNETKYLILEECLEANEVNNMDMDCYGEMIYLEQFYPNELNEIDENLEYLDFVGDAK